MGSREGLVRLERAIDAIVVGRRQRQDMGDIDELMNSMRLLGQLQPLTITPEGVLICGGRRLEAAKRLGWKTVGVWVRAGLSEPLERLLAEQHENTVRKPFTPTEAAALYEELKAVLADVAAARQRATQFGAARRDGGLAESAIPPGLEPRVQAAQLVTGRKSYTMLEQVCELQRLASDSSTPDRVRRAAVHALAGIEADGKVHGHFRHVKAVQADLERQPPEPSPERPARTGARRFMLAVMDVRGWTKPFDATAVAPALDEAQIEIVEELVAETVALAEALRAARSA
ncbi:MAG TPA: ParB N-terminal domain-containing protein [Euzebya sp.]|nr:ParB N-terminal domain-containing protein [Euzebya sp.]